MLCDFATFDPTISHFTLVLRVFETLLVQLLNYSSSLYLIVHFRLHGRQIVDFYAVVVLIVH